jgi:lactate 2-monooxygenase
MNTDKIQTTITFEPAKASEEPPKSTEWSLYMLNLYRSRQPPVPLGTVRFEDIEEAARKKLEQYPGAFDYAGGSAGTNSTYRANLRSLEIYRIIPRMLRDCTYRDLQTNFLGKKRTSPILLAPIGVQGTFSEDGELAPAKAAAKLGVPFIMSTASTRSLEQVAEVMGDAERWYQLYWPRTDEVTVSLLSRAKATGFSNLVITLDTNLLGWRPHDLLRSYIPFGHGVGSRIGATDPVFLSRFPQVLDPSDKPLAPGDRNTEGKSFKDILPDSYSAFPYLPGQIDKAFLQGMAGIDNPETQAAKKGVFLGTEFLKETNSGVFRTWDDLKFLKETWGDHGKVLLKGIQSVEDAEQALDLGLDGIVVSNHGGRQIDGALPSFLALVDITASPKIKAAQKAGTFTVLFDSGIRTGSDIFKAIAVGAQGVLLGRPYLYGAVIGGAAGVEQVIRHTLADLDVTMGLSGYKNLDEFWAKGEAVVRKVEM